MHSCQAQVTCLPISAGLPSSAPVKLALLMDLTPSEVALGCRLCRLALLWPGAGTFTGSRPEMDTLPLSSTDSGKLAVQPSMLSSAEECCWNGLPDSTDAACTAAELSARNLA